MVRILASSSEEMVLDNGLNPSLLFGIILLAAAIVIAVFALPSFASYPSVVSSPLLALPIGLILLGVRFLLSACWTTVIISKSRAQIAIVKKKLFRAETTTCEFTNIQRVEFRINQALKKVNMAVNPVGALLTQPFLQARNVTIMESVIVLKNGGEIVVGRSEGVSESMAPGFGKTESSPLSHLAAFIGVPFVKIGE
jgi:hypothetical protein